MLKRNCLTNLVEIVVDAFLKQQIVYIASNLHL
jgi:hypothetical protein